MLAQPIGQEGGRLKLGVKVALSQLLFGMVALLAIYGLVMFVWVKNYEQLEQNVVHDNIRRAQYLWSKEQSTLVSSVGDWAPWDDLYAFAQQPNQREFIEKNLQDASMANLQVDIVVVTDPTGKILFTKAIDQSSKSEIPAPSELHRYIKPQQKFLLDLQQELPLSGVLWLQNRPVFLAAQRIFKSDHSGDSPGILVFLRIVDEKMMQEMADILQAPVQIIADHQFEPSKEHPYGHGHDTVGEFIRAYIPVKDLTGTTTFAVTIDTVRTFYLEVRKQVKYFLLLILCLIGAIVALSITGLNLIVVRRLKQMDEFLKQVNVSGGVVQKIALSGRDELNQVATTVNQMLERIVADSQKIEQINSQLQEELAERKRAETVLQYSSEHDALTGLFNRRYLETVLVSLRQTGAKEVGVICCDLDGLKLVNDTFGHAAGDVLLQRTAARLREVLPESALIARVGGDEFVVLLTDVDEPLLQRAYKQFQEYTAVEMKSADEFPLQISVGYRYRLQCESGSNELDQMLKEADDEMYRQKLSSTHSNRNVVVQTIMKMLEIRDYATEGHSQRMGNLAVALAERIGLANNSKNDLRLLAQFHDLGKIGIPDQILLKPGPLTAEERKEMERHSEIGHRIAMVVPEFLPVADLILKHHEWWNGTGYPLGLHGEAIPVENRILSIVDAYDAMTSDRPYRAAMTQNAAIEELRRCRGSQFDPVMVDEFIALLAAGTLQRVDFE